jgi:tRNA 2-thiouridine synthesizing protein B
MLYLIDKPLADVGLRTARTDPDARVVLLQDGVLLAAEGGSPLDVDAPVSAVATDVDVRGVDLRAGVDRITYDDLVSLIVDREVRSFV